VQTASGRAREDTRDGLYLARRFGLDRRIRWDVRLEGRQRMRYGLALMVGIGLGLWHRRRGRRWKGERLGWILFGLRARLLGVIEINEIRGVADIGDGDL
jgi:hypothetical protein